MLTTEVVSMQAIFSLFENEMSKFPCQSNISLLECVKYFHKKFLNEKELQIVVGWDGMGYWVNTCTHAIIGAAEYRVNKEKTQLPPPPLTAMRKQEKTESKIGHRRLYGVVYILLRAYIIKCYCKMPSI